MPKKWLTVINFWSGKHKRKKNSYLLIFIIFIHQVKWDQEQEAEVQEAEAEAEAAAEVEAEAGAKEEVEEEGLDEVRYICFEKEKAWEESLNQLLLAFINLIYNLHQDFEGQSLNNSFLLTTR